MTATESLIGFEQTGIGSLLRQNLLRVPPNQREYAWTDREVGQLFTDLARAIGDDSDYFLGTIVTIPRTNGHLEVVDGQQRLATTAILLAAIRLYMKEVGEDILEQDIGDFLTGIDRAKRTYVPRMTLNSSDHEHFRAIVTFDGASTLPEPSLESHRLLLAAYERARAHVRKIVAPLDMRDHGDRLNAWVTFLESRTRVVLLKVPDDSDAYRMFEILNDRGLRTSQADLIKNYVFGRAGERIAEAQNRWAFMRGTLETIDEDALTMTFLRHALIVQHGFLRQTEVYDEVQDTVRSEEAAVAFTVDQDRLAACYVATFNPEHEMWNPHPSSSRQAIRVLSTLNIRPLRPVVLAVAARMENRVEASGSLQFLLSLGVRLLIGASTRSGAVELPLAHAAHSIWETEVSIAAELKASLTKITPSDEEFRVSFESARVSNARLARYYLRSLETAAKDESEPWFMPTEDETVINLEHVLPKQPGMNWPRFNDDEVRLYGRRLGNLALMRVSDNSTVRSDAFEEKKVFYAKSPYVLTQKIADYPQWTVQTITERQSHLAALALKAWPIR